MKTPKYFLKHPYDSATQHMEDEIVARNIMVILSRTGDMWRKLTWGEYEKERMKDGGFTGLEFQSFNNVVDRCSSQKSAESFSPNWR